MGLFDWCGEAYCDCHNHAHWVIDDLLSTNSRTSLPLCTINFHVLAITGKHVLSTPSPSTLHSISVTIRSWTFPMDETTSATCKHRKFRQTFACTHPRIAMKQATLDIDRASKPFVSTICRCTLLLKHARSATATRVYYRICAPGPS